MSKAACNNELIGKWRSKPISYGINHDITDECLMHINGTFPYSFPDEDTLLYGIETYYRRVSGDPYTLIGVWQDDSTGEILSYFEDGTSIGSSTNDDYVWTATFTATDTHITSRELRYRIETNGSNITLFHLVYNTEKHGTFEIVSSDKWILRLDGEDEETYYRE